MGEPLSGQWGISQPVDDDGIPGGERTGCPGPGGRTFPLWGGQWLAAPAGEPGGCPGRGHGDPAVRPLLHLAGGNPHPRAGVRIPPQSAFGAPWPPHRAGGGGGGYPCRPRRGRLRHGGYGLFSAYHHPGQRGLLCPGGTGSGRRLHGSGGREPVQRRGRLHRCPPGIFGRSRPGRFLRPDPALYPDLHLGRRHNREPRFHALRLYPTAGVG